MDYQQIYNDLISKACDEKRTKQSATYYENHHILPRCMGGTDDSFNLILLTAKEHWVAHCLLTKITSGRDLYKMSQALILMGRVIDPSKRQNSGLYEKARKNIAVEVSRRHTGTLIVKDKKTGIRIGRVSKNHPNVLSGKWIFFHIGMQRSDALKARISVNTSGSLNGNALDISNDDILSIVCECYQKYGVISYKLAQLYADSAYSIRLPSVHTKSIYRKMFWSHELYKSISNVLGIPENEIKRNINKNPQDIINAH